MAILFYDHLINRHHVHIVIDSMTIEIEEKSKLKKLVDEILHSQILSHILERLSPKHHGRFLEDFQKTPYDPQVIQYLRIQIGPDIDDTIREHSDGIIQKIIKDLKPTNFSH